MVPPCPPFGVATEQKLFLQAERKRNNWSNGGVECEVAFSPSSVFPVACSLELMGATSTQKMSHLKVADHSLSHEVTHQINTLVLCEVASRDKPTLHHPLWGFYGCVKGQRLGWGGLLLF